MMSASDHFGQLVLGHGLARAEGAGYGRAAALAHGEERVYDPLARDEGPVYGPPVGKGPRSRTGHFWERHSGVRSPRASST